MKFKDLQLQHKLFSTHTVRYQFSGVEEVCLYSFLETVCSNCTSFGKLSLGVYHIALIYVSLEL